LNTEDVVKQTDDNYRGNVVTRSNNLLIEFYAKKVAVV